MSLGKWTFMHVLTDLLRWLTVSQCVLAMGLWYFFQSLRMTFIMTWMDGSLHFSDEGSHQYFNHLIRKHEWNIQLIFNNCEASTWNKHTEAFMMQLIAVDLLMIKHDKNNVNSETCFTRDSHQCYILIWKVFSWMLSKQINMFSVHHLKVDNLLNKKQVKNWQKMHVLWTAKIMMNNYFIKLFTSLFVQDFGLIPIIGLMLQFFAGNAVRSQANVMIQLNYALGTCNFVWLALSIFAGCFYETCLQFEKKFQKWDWNIKLCIKEDSDIETWSYACEFWSGVRCIYRIPR